jgi:hypothetical protein
MNQWKVTELPKSIPKGRDEQGHPLRPAVGNAYKRRIKRRMKRNRGPRNRRRP